MTAAESSALSSPPSVDNEKTASIPAQSPVPSSVVSYGMMKTSRICDAAILLAIGTIILCYVLAVRNGHVPLWLPMISDCAVQAPEKYPFRIGIILSAFLVFLNGVFFFFFIDSISSKTTYDKIAVVIAALSSFCLSVVGAVNEDENMTIHGASAVIFFGGQLIFMWMSTIRLHGLRSNPAVSAKSIAQKYSMCTCVTVLILLFALMSGNYGRWGIEIAVCEWTGTFVIMLFNWSFNYEFSNGQYVGNLIYSPSMASGSTSSV